MFRDGGVHIVSVVSAKAESEGQRVSLGTSLAEPLNVLRHELDEGRGYYVDTARTERRIKVGERLGSGGAKFVKSKN